MSYFANLSHVTEDSAQQLLFFTRGVVDQDLFCCYWTGGLNALSTSIDESRKRIESYVCRAKPMERLSTDYQFI